MLLRFKLSCLVLSPLFCVFLMNAQPVDISGIVNVYSGVTAVLQCPNIVRVENPERFAVGDTVLLIQMKGARADTTAGATFGQVTAMNRAGRFEQNVVDSIYGSAIRLRYRMLTAPNGPAYEAGEGVQLIRIPSYSEARVVSTLTCPPWDGKTGGVVMIIVRNTLTLSADITADGKGFDQEDGIAATNQIVAAGGLATAGRGGAWMGLANSAKNGGSGGAHAGCGGLATLHSPQPVRYQAGYNWIFMGGGGGSAADSTAKGGRGGGVVIVDAQRIASNKVARITSRGLRGENGVASNVRTGGAGGGAGGAILVTALTLVNVPGLVVDGGAAGNSATNAEIDGGGGGGGVVLFGTPTPANLNAPTYAGGASSPGQEGCNGRIYHNNAINYATILARVRSYFVVDDTTVCAGTPGTLVANVDGIVSWSDGTTTLCTDCDTLRITPSATSTYFAILTYTDGCADTARVVVTVRQLPVLTIAEPPPFCDSIVVVAPAGFARYVWDNGDTTATIVVRTARTHTLTVYDDLGCYASASITTRFRGDTVLAFTMLPADGSPVFIDSIFPGELACIEVPVRNTTDVDIAIRSARMARGVEISVPPAQFALATSPAPAGGTSAMITVCASASIPGVYTDTMFLLSACGEIACPLTATILETNHYSRCNVRVTSDGEIEVLAADARPVVADLMGRELPLIEIEQIGEGAYVVKGLTSGAYVLRIGTATRLILR